MMRSATLMTQMMEMKRRKARELKNSRRGSLAVAFGTRSLHRATQIMFKNNRITMLGVNLEARGMVRSVHP